MEQMDALTAAATQSILPPDDPGMIEEEGQFNHSIPAIKSESGAKGITKLNLTSQYIFHKFIHPRREFDGGLEIT
jgi:hypothetical protein